MTLGDLQHLTMLAVARLDAGAYGAAIQEELARVGGRKVSVPTIYVTLLRLEERGLVRSHEEKGEERRAGRRRRIFQLTAAGWRALEHSRDALDRMWQGVVRS